MIDRCVDMFKQRHPEIPVSNPGFLGNMKLSLQIFGISLIPIINFFLAFLCSILDDEKIAEVIDNIEENHREELQEISAAVESLQKLEDESKAEHECECCADCGGNCMCSSECVHGEVCNEN